MLHVTRNVHVGMKWHAMTYALHLCTGHHGESGVSTWLGSTLCLVFDHGKSTQCLAFDHGKSTLCLVFDGGLYILNYIESWIILVFGLKTFEPSGENPHCCGREQC